MQGIRFFFPLQTRTWRYVRGTVEWYNALKTLVLATEKASSSRRDALPDLTYQVFQVIFTSRISHTEAQRECACPKVPQNTSGSLGKCQDSPNSTSRSQLKGNPVWALLYILHDSENELHKQNLLSWPVVPGVIAVDHGHFPHSCSRGDTEQAESEQPAVVQGARTYPERISCDPKNKGVTFSTAKMLFSH